MTAERRQLCAIWQTAGGADHEGPGMSDLRCPWSKHWCEADQTRPSTSGG